MRGNSHDHGRALHRPQRDRARARDRMEMRADVTPVASRGGLRVPLRRGRSCRLQRYRRLLVPRMKGDKRCTHCGDVKPLSAFCMRTDRPNQPQPYCRRCGVKRVQDWKAKNPDKYLARNVERNRRNRARGVGRLGRNPTRCEICGCKFVGVGRQGPQFDHHHGNGKARGWLCAPCNRALGMLGDNPAIVRAALLYLRRHGSAPTRPHLS